jgi:hypothetical protein
MTKNQTLGISQFVIRQTKDDFVGTKVTESKLEKLRSMAEQKLNLGIDVSDGYADFCKIVTVRDMSLKCPIAEITEENEHLLRTRYRQRSKDELGYLSRHFPKGSIKPTKSHHVSVILYTKAQLEKEGDDVTGADYDIICVNAEAEIIDAPMTPVTMVRNALGTEYGGSDHPVDKVKHEESVAYWSRYAMIEY